MSTSYLSIKLKFKQFVAGLLSYCILPLVFTTCYWCLLRPFTTCPCLAASPEVTLHIFSYLGWRIGEDDADKRHIVSQPGVMVLPVCSHFRWNWNRKQVIILSPSLAWWYFRSALTSGGTETGNRSLYCLPAWRGGTSGLLSLPVELKQETCHYIVSQPGRVDFRSVLSSGGTETGNTGHYIVSQPGRVDFRSALTSGGTKTGNRSLYCFPIWPSGLPVNSIFLWNWNKKQVSLQAWCYFRSNFTSGGTKIGNSFLYHFPSMAWGKEIWLYS